MTATGTKIVPMLGFGTGRKSANVSVQQRTNLYVEIMEDDEKGKLLLYSRPGLVRNNYQTSGGDASPIAPIRGMIVAYNDNGDPSLPECIYVACANCFFRLTTIASGNVLINFLADGSATLPSTGGPVRMAYNGIRPLATDGTMLYNLQGTIAVDTGGFSLPPDPQQIGKTLCFLGGFYVMEDPSGPGKFRWSDIYAGTTWQPLNFATAELAPDPLTGVFSAHGELWLFGLTTLEFWALQPFGTTGQQPFTRIQGAAIDWGTSAYDTIKQVGGGGEVCFVGRNIQGQRQVVMVQGYRATVVSTPDIDREIAADVSPDTATAVTEIHSGHIWYVLNLSTRSWAFDLTASQKVGAPVWEIWSTDAGRYAGQWAATAFGRQLQSDYRDLRIYLLDADVYTDDGQMLAREVQGKHMVADYDRFAIDEMFIDCETGSSDVDTPAVSNGLRFLGAADTLTGGWGSVPDVAAHQLVAPYTIEAVVRIDAPLSTTPRTVVRKMNSTAVRATYFIEVVGDGLGNSILRCGCNPQSGNVIPQLPYVLTLGVPVRATMTVAPTQVALFVNGSFVASAVLVGGFTAPAGEPLSIGGESPDFFNVNPYAFFNGIISDVRIWNVLRTPAQITDAAWVRLIGNEAGLVSYYKMDESSGTVLVDTRGVQNAALLNFNLLPGYLFTTFASPLAAPGKRDPQLMLQWSKDGGHTFGNEIWQSLGALGGYVKRAVWRNLGLARDWVFRIRITDPVKVVIINAAMRLRN